MRRLIITATVVSFLLLIGATSASAETLSPWWHLTSGSRPTNLPPGGKGEIVAMITNLGDAAASGCVKAPGAGKYKDPGCSEEASEPGKGEFELSPVRITDTLPPGLKATGVVAITPVANGAGFIPCALDSQSHVSCTFVGSGPEVGTATVGLPPYYSIEVRIAVEVAPAAASGELNQLSVSGGQAPSVTVKRPIRVSSEPTPFGVEDYELAPEEPGGVFDTQAGSHPFQTSFTVAMNQAADHSKGEETSWRPAVRAVGLAKDLRFKLPPGLVGNPTAFPQCPISRFLHEKFPADECPAETAMGVATVFLEISTLLGYTEFTVPLFNVEPQAGEPARFGFFLPLAEFGVLIDTSVRTGGDYGVTSTTGNIDQNVSFLSAAVTLWGVPGDPRHNASRGWGCLEESTGSHEGGPCTALGAGHPHPFLDLPTSCTGPLQTSVEADSWMREGNFLSSSGAPLPALDGCNRLAFVPEIMVTPDGHQASKPTGLTVDVHVPQEGQLNSEGLAQSNIKDIAVTLPEGVILNPSAADGLQSCSEAQIGYLPGESHPPSELHFTPKIEPPFCPDAAKVGTVKIKTPLLPNPLEGAVYLASPQNFHVFPQENPFESLVAMYIVARDPVSGVLVKLPGKVTLNEATGQISSTFEDNPQLPFEDAEIHFFGGERAPLATPSHCETYTTAAEFTPWSGNPPIKSSSSFQVTSGPNGSPCPGTLPFSPSLAAGSPNINAGSFSPLTTTISRADGNQNIQTVQLHMAPGMSGILAGVPLCPEAQANAGTCGPESLIGETIVSVGLGGDPYTVTGGKVYLTEKYQGGSFGLSIVNPADAGPFHLGKVIVRARIEIDPRTAALTITTGQIPHIIDGFPLQIKHVNVLINRPGFTFNPTNCNPMSITGTIGAVEGATSPVSDPFQVTNCATLGFAPKLSVITGAKSSKVNGAGLFFKISYPKGAQGNESWFNEAKFDIPRQLPARLTTIQKACIAATFEADRGACPAASIIGHAVVHTPVLPVPLEGPVYFVSYGGAKFPDAVLVLDGYGVHIELHGETFIGKGITSATFRNTPDVPFESIEVSIPTGPFSEFGPNLPEKARYSFCGQKLKMPTLFKAQNGLEIHQQTPISVTGCPKAKKHKKKKKKGRKAGKSSAGHKGRG
jgi:hypothetical protein